MQHLLSVCVFASFKVLSREPFKQDWMLSKWVECEEEFTVRGAVFASRGNVVFDMN